MSNHSGGRSLPISDRDRGIDPTSRGVASEIAPGGRHSQSGGSVLDSEARAEARAESAAAVERLKWALAAERKKSVDRLLERDADLGLGKRKAFPTLSENDLAKFQQSAAALAHQLG